MTRTLTAILIPFILLVACTSVPTPMLTATPAPANVPLPTETLLPTSTPLPTNTSTATASPTPKPTNTSSPTVTSEPSRTPIPELTKTPTLTILEASTRYDIAPLFGEVQLIGGDKFNFLDVPSEVTQRNASGFFQKQNQQGNWIPEPFLGFHPSGSQKANINSTAGYDALVNYKKHLMDQLLSEARLFFMDAR